MKGCAVKSGVHTSLLRAASPPPSRAEPRWERARLRRARRSVGRGLVVSAPLSGPAGRVPPVSHLASISPP